MPTEAIRCHTCGSPKLTKEHELWRCGNCDGLTKVTSQGTIAVLEEIEPIGARENPKAEIENEEGKEEKPELSNAGCASYVLPIVYIMILLIIGIYGFPAKYLLWATLLFEFLLGLIMDIDPDKPDDFPGGQIILSSLIPGYFVMIAVTNFFGVAIFATSIASWIISLLGFWIGMFGGISLVVIGNLFRPTVDEQVQENAEETDTQ